MEVLRFDFADPETYGPCFAGIKKIFLMRPPHISDIKKLMYPALDAAKSAGVRQVVFLSLIGIEEEQDRPPRQGRGVPSLLGPGLHLPPLRLLHPEPG